jgi:hypothetical protein
MAAVEIEPAIVYAVRQIVALFSYGAYRGRY